MNPTISLLHASHGRPEKAIETWHLWMDRAEKPESIEYIFALNDDDPSAEVVRARCIAGFASDAANIGRLWPRFDIQSFAGSAPAWNAAAGESRGDLLVQVSDDFVPPQNWDQLLLDRIYAATQKRDLFGTPEFCDMWQSQAIVVRVGEHYRKDDLMTMFVCSRKYYKLQGEFLHGGYQSVFSDDDATIRAVAAARDGACILIDARDVVFRHETPYHTGAPQDETLKRQNSAEAYRQGSALFVLRNSKLIEAGLKTW